MKSFARISSWCLSAVVILASAFALFGCGISTETPRPTSSPIPSLAFVPLFTATPVPPQSPALTTSPIPSRAFGPVLIPSPSPVVDQIPTPVRSSGFVDGELSLLPSRATVAPIPQAVVTKPVSGVLSTPKSTPVPTVLHLFKEPDLYIRLPSQADQRQPLRVLLVLHGMGARGEAFAQSLIADADRNNWMIVAPTMPYQDYMQPALVMDDDLKISQMLLDTLDMLPARLNLKLKQHVLIYGFSRGAQLAHRFALFHPERVADVATMSAGTYTLPTEHSKDDMVNPLPFPFGVGDLQKHLGHPLDSANFRQISFWIAVGERDNQPKDVPRAFDPYVGQTRIDRARAFASALTSLGIDTRLVIFPNTGHEVTTEMRKGALQFLREDELKDNLN